jgi:hypothetical protein
MGIPHMSVLASLYVSPFELGVQFTILRDFTQNVVANGVRRHPDMHLHVALPLLSSASRCVPVISTQ